MFVDLLSEDTKSALESLVAAGLLSDFYLAGGTACALHLGHRQSFDLDFFSEKKFDPSGMALKLASLGRFAVDQADEGTLIGRLRDTRISFFHYPYPLLASPVLELGVRIAALPDLASMKVSAIASRGTRRDFVDLYFICRSGYRLKELIALFHTQYASVPFNHLHILKSLAYFDDAEKDPELDSLESYSWDELKLFFAQEAKAFTWE